MMAKQAIPALFCAMLSLLCVCVPADSEALSIIPGPKEITLLGDAMPVGSRTYMLLSRHIDRKTQIGVDEINKQCSSALGNSLPRISPDEVAGKAVQNLIVIGIPSREPWVQAYYRLSAGRLEKEPVGDEGYVIESITQDGMDVICVFAETPQGLLYGCVTLCNLFSFKNKRCAIARANIWDKPDFRYRMTDILKDHYVFKRENARSVVDFALKHKINMIWSGFDFDVHADLINSDKTWFRAINEYAWARGIRIMYYSDWSLEKTDVPDGANKAYYPYKGMIGSRGMAFDWNRDDLLELKCSRITHLLQEIRAKAILFHPIDTGDPYNNPELWNNRSEATKQRFGNDRAAADAHLINTFYKTVKSADPDILFLTAVYPYHAEVLKEQNISEWLTRLSTLIPPDVYVSCREAARDAVERWKSLLSQPVFFYHEPESLDWEIKRPFITSFRFARTFYFAGNKDIYWYTASGPVSREAVLGAAEFSWNASAPGAEYLQDYKTSPSWVQATGQDPNLMYPFLLKVAETLFGCTDGKELAQVLGYNLSPLLMAKGQTWVSKDYCTRQAEYAQKALLLLDAAGSHVTNNRAYFKIVYGRSLLTRYFAEARLHALAGKEQALAGKQVQAGEEMTRALAAIDEGQKRFLDFTHGSLALQGLDYQALKKTFMNDINSDAVLKTLLKRQQRT